MSKKLRFIVSCAFIFMLSVAVVERDAQARSQDEVRAEFLKAFDVVYANPGDVEATLHYAKLAVELGDYEAALSPLERLLMINPQLPEVRLELGVMYYNLKSNLVAREHLQHVAEDATATEALKKRASDYLAKL